MADIVIIDDEEAFLRALKLRLEDLGHRVRTAVNGDLGLKLVRQGPPDLLITDVIMPEREGIETLLEMRRNHPEVKVVVMSGGGRVRKMDFLDIAEKLGADAVLAKPFSAGRLQEVIEETLTNAR